MEKNRKLLLEKLLVLYFVVGMFKGVVLVQYTDYILSLVIQGIVMFYFFSQYEKKIEKKVFILYIINLSIILFILFRFIYLGIETEKIIIRLLPLLSIFGIIIVRAVEIDMLFIVRKTVKLYSFLGVVIILDSMFYMVIGKNIWTPISYLGNRFSGPFYDANFYGLVYAIIFLIIFSYKELELESRNILLSIAILNIGLSKSWSVIIILFISLIVSQIIKFNNLFIKQILLLFFYLIFVVVLHNNIEYLMSVFVSTTTKYLDLNDLESIAKFKSLEYRIDAQMSALNMSYKDLFGKGPQQLVPLLGRDVHNSYVGFLFELGIFGTMLQVFNMRSSKKKYVVGDDILTTFLILMAFTLNVHYSSIYMLVILIIWNNQLQEPKILFSI